jgi:HD-GYP domain-containing protein (c-di-GMP phosphodiesterase class II)
MALREMDAHAGTQFDPEIVAAMRTSISEQDTIEKRPTPPPGR